MEVKKSYYKIFSFFYPMHSFEIEKKSLVKIIIGICYLYRRRLAARAPISRGRSGGSGPQTSTLAVVSDDLLLRTVDKFKMLTLEIT